MLGHDRRVRGCARAAPGRRNSRRLARCACAPSGRTVQQAAAQADPDAASRIRPARRKRIGCPLLARTHQTRHADPPVGRRCESPARATRNSARTADTRAPATSLTVTLRGRVPCDVREAMPKPRQPIQPLDVQITRTVTTIRFPGLMSRCSTPRECAQASASAASIARSRSRGSPSPGGARR